MLASIDCDLRTSYLVTDQGLGIRAPDPIKALHALGPAAGNLRTVLFEIASPVSFNRGAAGHAAMTQLAKWAIWNTAQAVRVNLIFFACDVLVAPSNVWTRGYDLKTRHQIAKCKRPKKDLRECEAMQFFYKQRPTDWVPLADYLAAL